MADLLQPPLLLINAEFTHQVDSEGKPMRDETQKFSGKGKENQYVDKHDSSERNAQHMIERTISGFDKAATALGYDGPELFAKFQALLDAVCTVHHEKVMEDHFPVGGKDKQERSVDNFWKIYIPEFISLYTQNPLPGDAQIASMLVGLKGPGWMTPLLKSQRLAVIFKSLKYLKKTLPELTERQKVEIFFKCMPKAYQLKLVQGQSLPTLTGKTIQDLVISFNISFKCG